MTPATCQYDVIQKSISVEVYGQPTTIMSTQFYICLPHHEEICSNVITLKYTHIIWKQYQYANERKNMI